MHVNRQIRDVVSSYLGDTGLVTVSSNRGKDLLPVDLPAGVVGTGLDTIVRWNKGTKDSGPEDLRTIALTVTVVALGDTDTLDDDLDALRAQIEPRVDAALAGLAVEVRHTGGEMEIGTDDEGERWFAFLVLSWEVDVATEVSDPERALI